ncbi:MAG: peptidoglycan editing factor PgeF [Clostridiales bacterium]|nr:peptidoglycan editing factor PgeF [Clostridiales bacterium]
MKSQFYKNLEILKFTNITTKHGFTTINGGVSQGGYRSLNFGIYAPDKREHVLENYEIFFDALAIDKNKSIATHQTHSNHIAKIDSVDEFKVFEDTDGFITNIRGVNLMTFYADCTPLYFYDPAKKVIGIAHSGWKGTEKKIGVKMIEAFVELYGSKKENILVGIGPNISPHYYAVSDDFLDNFEDRSFFTNYIYHKEGITYFDMVNSNRDMLINNGILEKNIELSGHCTYKEADRFFSYRRQGAESGRMAGFIMLD